MLDNSAKTVSFPAALMGACLLLLAGCVETGYEASPESLPEPVAPAAPANLVATAGNAQVSLAWAESSGATSYVIRRSTVNGGPYTMIASPTTVSSMDFAVANGTTYYYVVSAASSAGESANSAQASSTPQAPQPPPPSVQVPAAPTTLSAIAGNATVALSWSASSGATSYSVKRSTTSGGPYTGVTTTTSTSATDSNVVNGTTYYYVVSARNTAGEGANSSQVTAAPAVPTAPPPPVIGSCNNLPQANKWEVITPPVAVTQAIVLDPFNVGTIWAASTSTGIFRSDDCGATWKHVNTGTNGASVGSGAIWSMVADPVVPGTMYVIGQYGPQGVYKSTNFGVDWTQTMAPGGNVANTMPAGPSNPTVAGVGSISINPKNHNHLVAGAHANCTGQWAPACGAITRDGGATWSFFKTPFLDGWAEQAGPYFVNDTTIVYATLFQGIWYSSDSGATWKNVTPAGVQGASGGEYTTVPLVPASNGNLYLPGFGGNSGLIESKDNGASWTWVQGSPSGGYMLGIAVGKDRIYLGDAQSRKLYVAKLADLSKWTEVPNIPVNPVFLQYDDDHHILYAAGSNGFGANGDGIARIVLP